MKMGKRKWCLLLTACLLTGLTTGLGVTALPSRAPSGPLVSVQSPRTIDGDPIDWIGTPGPDNTYYVNNGEGIWTDPYFDDTGNGSYIYPNVTHTSPAIPDSKGWEGYAYAYTGYPHGGMVDLREFRITGDNKSLYILLRFENMGSQEIAVEWNKNVHEDATTDPSGQWQYANATGFGKILVQVYIDQDMVPGSGRTNSTMFGNFLIAPEAAWEVVIDVAGDPYSGHGFGNGYGFPQVEFANGTIYNLTATVASTEPLQPRKAVYIQANCDVYPAVIELEVPYDIIGDPRGKGWRFTVVAGGYDEGRWRQVWSTELAKLMGWPPMFRFIGGEGGDPTDAGDDPNIIDITFTNTSSYADQEALLNSFTTGQLVVVDAYLEIYFDENGEVISWVPIYSLPILLMVILYVKKKRLTRLVKHQ